MARFLSVWRNLLRRDRIERDLDEEVRAAFDLLVSEKIASGVGPEEARRTAALELGGIESVKEQVRDARSGASIESLLQDVRHAGRALRQSPAFTLTAVMSLAIGIAGTAVVFSLADAYLFRNRPGISDPSGLAEVGRVDTGADPGHYYGDGFFTFSYPNYLDYRERQTLFEDLAAYRPAVTFGLGIGDTALRVPGSYVSANYLAVLGVPIPLGRGFLPEEERLASPRSVAVISDRLWRAQFGAARDVIGRTIHLNGRPFTIVGVTAPGFHGYTIAVEAVWVPITAYPDGDDLSRVALRDRQWLMGIGRLKTGVTIDQARAEMAVIARDLEREYPEDNRRHGLGVESAGAVPVVGRLLIGRFVGLLFAFVGLILLIASFNVAGMLLARGAGRAREISLRLALGAGRARVMRLLVLESLIVSFAGAAVGLAFAWGAIRLIERAIPPFRIDLAFALSVDWRVMTFAVAVAIVTGLACGLLPARSATRVDLATTIVRQGIGQTRRLRARSAFVTAQIAFSVLLMVCGLLLGRSLLHAARIPPGFAVHGVEAMGLDLRLGGYDAEKGRVFIETLMSRLERLPGLQSVAAARVVPLTGETEGGRLWLPHEHGDERAIAGSQNIVTPGYFRTLEIPLLAGRTFRPSDGADAPAVAIVNETLARRAWPGESPIGRQFVVGEDRYPIQVVGVVRDAKYRTIGEPSTPFFYVPAAQRYESVMWLLVRPSGRTVLPEVRALVRELDPNLPILQAATLTELSAFTLFPQRVAAWLAAIAAMVGVLLAALGVYSVTAYHAGQRRRETGIRIALGALRAQVLRSVAGGAMWLAAAGTALGLTAAALVSRLLEGMLYGVRPLDPVSFLGAAVVVVALALVASVIPARRAASVNPVEALRAE